MVLREAKYKRAGWCRIAFLTIGLDCYYRVCHPIGPSQCPLWVRPRSGGMSALSLLSPNEQTLIGGACTSGLCQQRTFSLSLVGVCFWLHLSRGGASRRIVDGRLVMTTEEWHPTIIAHFALTASRRKIVTLWRSDALAIRRLACSTRQGMLTDCTTG